MIQSHLLDKNAVKSLFIFAFYEAILRWPNVVLHTEIISATQGMNELRQDFSVQQP